MRSDVLAPLGVFLQKIRSGDPAADEVVILTFNHDLAFFESAALGIVQQTGAPVTIVADARVAHHDLYAVRRAGTAYLPGLAWCSGSFHPKVLVIAGQTRATVAIGSGNLSLAGWQGNDELWSIHHADRETGSAVVAQTAAWLRTLADFDAVALTDGVPQALHRTAGLLEPLVESNDESRVVDSLQRPILDQLPEGPVDRLAVYAPFHDPGARALAALLRRLRPTETIVAVQPTLTRIDGPAVASLLGAGGRVITLADTPYRHGKLIEWEQAGERWALTGSPNISRAALLTATADGGNVELGVISRVEDWLLPQGVAASALSVAALRYVRHDRHLTPSVSILGAVRTADGLVLSLARELPQPATVEVSPVGSAPDAWRVAAPMSEGERSCLVPEDIGAGSRVRLRLGEELLSTVAFVIDPARVRRPHRPSTARHPTPDWQEVITEPKAAEQLARILDELRRTHGSMARSPTAGGSARSTGSADVGDWEDYLDRCQGRIGHVTLAFALGLPMSAHSQDDSPRPADVDWDLESVDDEQVGGLDDDDPEEADEAVSPTPSVVPSLHGGSDEARRRYRAVADQMIRRWHEPDPHERLLALRFVLVLVAGGAWSPHDKSWVNLALDGVANLDISSPAPEYEDLAGSLAALTLSLVRSSFPPGERTLMHRQFERTVAGVDHLLVGAERDRIAVYAEGLEGRFRAYSDPDIVLDLRNRLLNANPVDDAMDALSDLGIAAIVNGHVIDLTKAVPDPLVPAFTALAHAEHTPLLAVRSPGTNGWATLLWRPPYLVVVRPGKPPGTLFTQTYRYRPNDSLADDIRTNSRPNSDRIVDHTLAGQPPPHLAIEILEEVGLTTPEPAVSPPGRRPAE